MIRSSLALGLLLAFVGAGSAAGEMKPPRLSFAQVDWTAAAGALADIEGLPLAVVATRSRTAYGAAARLTYPALARLNAVMAQRFAGVARSPVPVLLPFDTAALMRDQAEGSAGGNERYLAGFNAANFFYPGPAGYDAAFSILARDIPAVADSSFKDPIVVQMSGSALLYELATPIASNGMPVPTLDAEFPGIRRQVLEHHLRYTFVRFGVPYVVSVLCFDAGVSRYKMPTCRVADQVALRFLRALRVVGGTPHKLRSAGPMVVERPTQEAPNFTYHAPGNLLAGTGFRGHSGRADETVYSQIRFPLEDAPAYVNSQMFQSRNRSPDPTVSANYAYPWRDNFCERRGFPVGQCPAGIGHQGQDIRPARCTPSPGSERCSPRDVVAVRGGLILRAPNQEAAYLFVNSAVEHIRFRYLHMSPRKMDEDNLLSGRRVYEGEVIGQVSNFNKRANGTSYHLHFDVQVPTKDGWVFVNPYMTLVAAYERLIGGRGVELGGGPALAATGETEPSVSPGERPRIKSSKAKRTKYAKRSKFAKRHQLKKPRIRHASR